MSKFYSIISADPTPKVVEVEGPSAVTSDDPHERKLARRQRVERRVEALKRQTIKDMGEEIVEEKNPIEIQMESSTEILEKFLKESEEYLENIKVANEAREVDRKETEGIGRADVIAQLEAEAAEAQKQFNQIEGNWASIHDYKDPLHIHDDILAQKVRCEELIQQKDEIINMLKQQLNLAERKFTKDQVKQNLDISILGQRIEKQIRFIRHAYNTEFRLIEQVINEEKQKYIDRSNQQWDELARKRNQEEINLSEHRFQKQEEMASNLKKLFLMHEDEFRQTKIQLELDVQNAQNEFERIKYVVLSNSERLDYDYQVLKRRENENITIKSQQKRKMSKLQDAISELKNTLSSYRENMNKEINKTRNNIQKMHKSILEIDIKADHFAMLNEKKFNDIWDMNAKDCFHLLTKIINTDKIVHEQQLGVQWERPVYNKIDKTSMPSYQRAVGIVKNLSKQLPEAKLSTKLVSLPEVKDVGYNPVYNKLLKYILKKVCNKSGFLTEKCLKQLINCYEDDEQSLVTLNNVFVSLDIKDPEDIDVMIEFFLPYCYCPICTNVVSAQESSVSSTLLSYHLSQVSAVSKSSFKSDYHQSVAELEEACDAIQQSDELIGDIVSEVVTADSLVDDKGVLKIELPDRNASGEFGQQADSRERRFSRRKIQRHDSAKQMACKNNHPLLLSTVYVLTALKDFVTSYYKQVDATPTVGERLIKKRITVSRLVDDKDIEDYWLFIKNIYSESNIQVCNALSEGLMRYLEILKERKNASEEVLRLRKRNEDLKRLLAQYMDHGVLVKPPCALQTEVLAKCSIPPYSDHK